MRQAKKVDGAKPARLSPVIVALWHALVPLAPYAQQTPAVSAKGQPQMGRTAAAKTKEPLQNDRTAEFEFVTTRRITLVVGQTTVVRLPELITKVITDRTVVEATVNPRDLHELIITALDRPGLAEIILLDRRGNRHRIELVITQDTSALEHVLNMRFPFSNIKIIPISDQSVLVTGQVENALQVKQVIEIASKFYPEPVNNLEVVGPQQVQLRVLVAEVYRTKLRSLGFNFLWTKIDGDTVRYLTSTVGNLVTLTATDAVSSVTGFQFALPNNDVNIMYGKLRSSEAFRAFLRALVEEGLAKVLAETTLTTFSGRASSMIVGGEFPIVIPGELGTFTVEFREYGNKLDVVPTVLGSGRIRLEVRPELSELDFENGVLQAGFEIPALRQRRVDTSVEMRSGETFVIGGLISTTDSASSRKVPVLGDLPIIGAAFRQVKYTREEKELIIMVTPELVEPLSPSQVTGSYPGSESVPPSDHELFLLGRIESRSTCGAAPLRTYVGEAVQGATGGQAAGPAAQLGTNRRAPTSQPESSQSVTAAAKSSPTGATVPVSLPAVIGPSGYEAGR